MTGRAAARIAILCLALASVASAEDNSGLDTLLTREDLRGFEPVGRVDVADGGFCTGALIAADLVLTAAHCVVGRDGAAIDASRITFRAGYAHGASLAEVRVARTLTAPGYQHMDPAPFEMIARDVALLQLADPIPSSIISPFIVARPGDGAEVSVVSYAQGREEALSWQRVCKVKGRKDTVLAVDCDVTFGASGAPVLDRSGYRPRIVSIISAGGTYEGGPIAFGMELPAIVDQLKAGLRRGDALSIAEGVSGARAGLAAPTMPGKPAGRIVMDSDGAGGGTDTGTGARFVSP